MTARTSHADFGTIQREHEALRGKLDRIHAVLSGHEPAADEIASLLREFQDMLTIHFDREEQIEGFFDEVTARAPQLTERADRLCVEHAELLREAHELYQFAAAGSPSVAWWRELHCRCREFNKHLIHHESEEHNLLQQAHQDEVCFHD